MTSTQKKAGLIQGPATIYTADVGTALPTISDLEALEAGELSGWTDRGRTTEGVQLVDTINFARADDDQSTRTVAVAVTSRETTLQSTCRQVTLDNLALAALGTAEDGSIEVADVSVVPEHAIALVGPGPEGTKSLVVVERGFVNSGIDVTLSRSDYSTLPLTFEVLEGDTLPLGFAYSFVDAADGSVEEPNNDPVLTSYTIRLEDIEGNPIPDGSTDVTGGVTLYAEFVGENLDQQEFRVTGYDNTNDEYVVDETLTLANPTVLDYYLPPVPGSTVEYEVHPGMWFEGEPPTPDPITITWA